MLSKSQIISQKVVLRYFDDIVRTVRGDIKELLDAVNNPRPNLQFTVETADEKKTICHFWTCQLTHNRRGQFFQDGNKNHQIQDQFLNITALHPLRKA